MVYFYACIIFYLFRYVELLCRRRLILNPGEALVFLLATLLPWTTWSLRSRPALPPMQVLKEGGGGSSLLSTLEMLRETVDNLVDG